MTLFFQTHTPIDVQMLGFAHVCEEAVLLNAKKDIQQKVNTSIDFTFEVDGFQLVVEAIVALICN